MPNIVLSFDVANWRAFFNDEFWIFYEVWLWETRKCPISCAHKIFYFLGKVVCAKWCCLYNKGISALILLPWCLHYSSFVCKGAKRLNTYYTY